jgi:hypothetical protein
MAARTIAHSAVAEIRFFEINCAPGCVRELVATCYRVNLLVPGSPFAFSVRGKPAWRERMQA